MERTDIKEILSKQLELLAEASKFSKPGELAELSRSMVAIASIIIPQSDPMAEDLDQTTEKMNMLLGLLHEAKQIIGSLSGWQGERSTSAVSSGSIPTAPLNIPGIERVDGPLPTPRGAP